MRNIDKIGRQNIRKILVISLSNIGDVILTFPVIDILKDNFPEANICVVIGEKAKQLLEGNPNVNKVMIYDKKQKIKNQILWILSLRKEKFDIVVDLRNTAIPLFLGAEYTTKLISRKRKDIHMKEKHLAVLKELFDYEYSYNKKYCIVPSDKNKKIVDDIMNANNIVSNSFIVIAPGAADYRKRWNEENFAELADRIADKFNLKVVFVGANDDVEIASNIINRMRNSALNICGKTTLLQLSEIIRRGSLVISNDSAASHLSSYLDKPTITIFGPTDPKQYGPWSSNCKYFACRENIDSINSKDIINAFNIIDGNVVLK